MNTVKHDVSAVEASYEISSLPLYRCTHQFQELLKNMDQSPQDALPLTGISSGMTMITHHGINLCTCRERCQLWVAAHKLHGPSQRSTAEICLYTGLTGVTSVISQLILILPTGFPYSPNSYQLTTNAQAS